MLGRAGIDRDDLRVDAEGRLVHKEQIKAKLRPAYWELYDATLGALAAECRSAGVPLVFVIIPRVGKADAPDARAEPVARLKAIAGHHALPVYRPDRHVRPVRPGPASRSPPGTTTPTPWATAASSSPWPATWSGMRRRYRLLFPGRPGRGPECARGPLPQDHDDYIGSHNDRSSSALFPGSRRTGPDGTTPMDGRHLSQLLDSRPPRRPDHAAVEDEHGRTLSLRRAGAASPIGWPPGWRAGASSRGDRVGLWLPKGLEAVAAIHGILRSGAAYVPGGPHRPGRAGRRHLRGQRGQGGLRRPPLAPALREAWAGPGPLPRLILVEGPEAPAPGPGPGGPPPRSPPRSPPATPRGPRSSTTTRPRR